jgi:N-acyl homoserine lactone hydrolase
MPGRSWLLSLATLAMCQACSLSSHPVVPSNLGRLSGLAEMEMLIDVPGPIEVETVNSADWSVPLEGLIDLKSAAARDAHLVDRDEPIHIFAHIVRSPKFGTYLVDTGVSQQVIDDPGGHGISRLIRIFMPLEKIQVRNSTAQILGRIPSGIQGVFFTHLHIDHIAGMPDIPANVPLYIGRGESTQTSFQNVATRGPTTTLFEGKAALEEWPFRSDEEHKTLAIGDVVDIFGDGSAYAISVPGHTPGSTAYLLRTPKGPVLLTGDTSHTRWGWEHGVEPGSYTADQPTNLKSLVMLKDLAARHPTLDVRFGHQL